MKSKNIKKYCLFTYFKVVEFLYRGKKWLQVSSTELYLNYTILHWIVFKLQVSSTELYLNYKFPPLNCI